MTDSTEHALEAVVAGSLFCMAIVVLLWLHGAFMQQIQRFGDFPERLILMECEGEM